MQFIADLQIAPSLGTINEAFTVREVESNIVRVPYMDCLKADQVRDRLRRREQERTLIGMTSRLQCGQGLDEKGRSITQKAGDTIYDFFTIFEWAPKLTKDIIKSDVIAGLTVGVMAVPQSMSYANIAGLGYVYGLYSAALPAFLYGLIGGSRQLAVGPVAMVSLLVEAGLRGKLDEDQCPAFFNDNPDDLPQSDLCPQAYAELAFLTCLVAGAIQVVAGTLRLGFLVSFLGHPVISGFTSGAAIIIGLSQAKYIFGFDLPKSQYIHETVANIINGLPETNGVSMCLGFAWIALLMSMKKIAGSYPKLSFLRASGPLVACVLSLILMYAFPSLHDDHDVHYVGLIEKGLPAASWGVISLGDYPKVFLTATTVSLIGYMESIAIGKSLAAKHGYELDATHEMIALGVTNVLSSGLSCYPVTGSFSRSAVNNQTGAKSQLSGVVTSGVVFLVYWQLVGAFERLPKFCLAAIVMSSVFPLVAVGEAKHLYHVSKKDWGLWIFAFLGTLFLGVLMGISLAVALSLVLLIYESVNPQISVLWRLPGTEIYRNVKQETLGEFVEGVLVVRIGAAMYFANASVVKDRMLQIIADIETVEKIEIHYLVIEMTPVNSLDSTALHVLEDLVMDFRVRDKYVAFTSVVHRVEKMMKNAGMTDKVNAGGNEWFFERVHDAVKYCLNHQSLMATRKKVSTKYELSDMDMAKSPSNLNGSMKLRTSSEEIEENEKFGSGSSPNRKADRFEKAGNTFVVSNAADPIATVMQVYMRKAWPTLLADLVQIFQNSDVFLAKCEAESEGAFMPAKLRFHAKAKATGKKLSREQMEHVQALVRNMWKTRMGGTRDDDEESVGSDGGRKSGSDAGSTTSARRKQIARLNGYTNGTNGSGYQLTQQALENHQVQHFTPDKPGMGLANGHGVEGAFVIPAGAVVMMPAGSAVLGNGPWNQYYGAGAGASSDERTPVKEWAGNAHLGMSPPRQLAQHVEIPPANAGSPDVSHSDDELVDL